MKPVCILNASIEVQLTEFDRELLNRHFKLRTAQHSGSVSILHGSYHPTYILHVHSRSVLSFVYTGCFILRCRFNCRLCLCHLPSRTWTGRQARHIERIDCKCLTELYHILLLFQYAGCQRWPTPSSRCLCCSRPLLLLMTPWPMISSSTSLPTSL